MSSAPILQHNVKYLRRTIHSLTAELLSVYEELALLYSLGPQLRHLTSESQIAEVAVREASLISSADCGWIAFWDGSRFRVPHECRIGISQDAAAHINKVVLESLLRNNRTNYISISLGQEHALTDYAQACRFLASALPLDGCLRGYLCLGRREAASGFLSPDQKLIGIISQLTALEIENIRLQNSESDKQGLLHELALARRIQQSLLPRDCSRIPFLEASGGSEPCWDIGGDFFDLLPLEDRRCVIVIADVAGKGPSAALQAAMAQGCFSAASRTCAWLPSLLFTVNDCLVARSTGNSFATAFVAILDPGGTLLYCNAGHTSALWIRGNGMVTELTQGGPPLGIFAKSSYSEAAVQLAPGDLLVCFTDGLTEAHNSQGESFGTERLLAWARGLQFREPAEVLQDLSTRVKQFSAGRVQEDDRSILVVRYRGE